LTSFLTSSDSPLSLTVCPARLAGESALGFAPFGPSGLIWLAACRTELMRGMIGAIKNPNPLSGFIPA